MKRQPTNERKKQIAHSFNIPGNCLSVFVMDSRLPLPFCHFVMSLVLHIILRLLGAFGRKRSFVLLYIFFLFNFQSLWLGIGIYLHSIRQSRRKNVRCWEITLFEMQPQRQTQKKPYYHESFGVRLLFTFQFGTIFLFSLETNFTRLRVAAAVTS